MLTWSLKQAGWLQLAFLVTGMQQPSVSESRVKTSSFLQIQRNRCAVPCRKIREKEINEELFRKARHTTYP